MRNLKKILLNITLVVAVLLVPATVFGATTVGNDVSVGGTLGVTGATTLTNVSSTNYSASGYLDINGATTLDGTVTLGDSASDSITITGKLGQIYISDGTTTSTLAKNSFIVAQAANFNVGKFYVDSSGNVSASGTLGVVGATTITGALVVHDTVTLNSALTFGDAATDTITVHGHILNSVNVGNGTTTTSTLASNSLALAKAADFNVGKFYVDSSGNVSASGTLGIVGATTLDGAVTLGNAYADDITVTGRLASALWASSTLYIGSAGGGEDLVVTNNAVTVGTTVNSSTLAVYGNTTLTGSLLPQHHKNYNLGSYTQAWNDVFVSSTLYTGNLTLTQLATTTIIFNTNDTTKGTCFVVRDVAGTQKFMTILTGNTVAISAVDCRN